MASTRSVIASPESQGNSALVSQLLTAVVAVDIGDWIDTLHYAPMSFHILGISTATVKIHGSNETTKPANAAHGFQIGSDITVDQKSIEYVGPIRWVKARVSAWTSGTINVYMAAAGND